jgi:adenylate cyclase
MARCSSPLTGPLIETVEALVARVEREDHGFPSIRVGIAYGPATNRAGDRFGRTVNLPSRAADAARPGRILATEEVQTQVPEREWKSTRRVQNLKGISARIRLYSLTTESDGGPN